MLHFGFLDIKWNASDTSAPVIGSEPFALFTTTWVRSQGYPSGKDTHMYDSKYKKETVSIQQNRKQVIKMQISIAVQFCCFFGPGNQT